jgi:hypothetical protein
MALLITTGQLTDARTSAEPVMDAAAAAGVTAAAAG